MTTALDLPVYGRTRWRRVGILMVPAFGLVAALIVLIAQGALAFNFALSGVPFVLNADKMEGNSFVQYGLPDKVDLPAGSADQLIRGNEAGIGLTPPPAGGAATNNGGNQTYVADTVTSLGATDITNLDQTVCAPLGNLFTDLVGLNMKVRIQAGAGQDPAHASNLLVQAPGMTAGSATFTNMTIGEDAGVALNSQALGGQFAQTAEHVVINNLHQVAVGTEAGSFTLPNLSLSARFTGAC